MLYNENTIVFSNGKFIKARDAKVSFFNQTLHYGIGVFASMRAYDTNQGTIIFKGKEHLAKLVEASKKMHLTLDLSIEQLLDICYELLKQNQLTQAYIRPLVYSDIDMHVQPTNKSNLTIAAWNWKLYYSDKPLKTMISSYQKTHPRSGPLNAKVVGHYTNSYLATAEAKNKGFDEAILLDGRGNIAQGAVTNIFIEKSGILYTPKMDCIYPGITRLVVFQLAEEIGVKVKEMNIQPKKLLDADSAFFTGTATELTGISHVNTIKLRLDWEDSIGHQLQIMYRRRVTGGQNSHFALR